MGEWQQKAREATKIYTIKIPKECDKNNRRTATEEKEKTKWNRNTNDEKTYKRESKKHGTRK